MDCMFQIPPKMNKFLNKLRCKVENVKSKYKDVVADEACDNDNKDYEVF